MASQLDLFKVDGELVRILPRAGASIRHPDVNLPVFRSDGDGHYLEMRVDADPDDASEVSLTRRIPLENLSTEEWEELKEQYDNINLEAYLGQGIKGLEKMEDRRVQRLTGCLANVFESSSSVECFLSIQSCCTARGVPYCVFSCK